MYQQYRQNHQQFRRQPSRVAKGFDPSHVVKNIHNDTTPEVTYVPKNQFNDFGFSKNLSANLSARNYTTPTPIQDQAIPLILQGKDVVGIANTGTGKTATFLLPMLNKALQDKTQKFLIMAPTRELAIQIFDEFILFSKNLSIKAVVCIGGASMREQMYQLRFGPQFVIGTPGRLDDLAKQGVIRFSTFNNVVLDEVDRMLDMGFIHSITKILSNLPQNRQSAFFSATTTPNVQRIMQKFLKEPVIITIKSKSTLGNIDQQIVPTKGKAKIEVLHDLLVSDGYDKVIVFGRTKWGLDKLALDLKKRGFNVATIHGNKTQSQRQWSLDQFKRNRISILLATDVASRGIDIENVSHVINYDLPETYEDYIHRIGRTGRASSKGTALTLVER